MVDRGPKDKSRRRRGRKGSKDFADSPAAAPAVVVEDSASYQPHNSLLIQLDETAPTWFQCGKQNAGRDGTVQTDPPEGDQKNTTDMINKYRSLADNIFRREIHLFAKKSDSSKDDRWVESTMKKGTLKDRIAAMSVVISTDPVHKFFALDGLLQMAGCAESGSQQTNSRVAQLAAEALEDLFLNTFLPSGRKLMTLSQRPLYLYEEDGASPKKKKTKKTLSPRILMLWRFEEMVKDKYQLFIRQYLGQTLRDGVEQQKVQALRTVSALMRSTPEAEAALLQLMVNKLGDPGKKTAASAGHELRKVLLQHPAMQNIIAREVQQLAHRPHLSSKALYSCIIFLNQLKLDRNEIESSGLGKTTLPASLISTYFRLFEVAVKKPKRTKKEDNAGDVGMKSRLLSALLTGVNRAHPYLPAKDQHLEEHVDSLYRVVHTAPPAAGTQALLLLFHLAIGSQQNKNSKKGKEPSAGQERFYRAVYSTLSQSATVGTGKHLTMYFNLLYKTMKNDTDASRVIAFAKRVLCTTIHCNPPVMAASLFLMNEVSKSHPALLSCFQEVIEGPDAVRLLDSTKREPRGALISPEDPSEDDSDRVKLAPGWEVSLTLHHFHPSVGKFSSSLGNIEYSGDPLRDFALAPFLDKFAYRNPKSVARVVGKFKGGSVAERRSGTESTMQSHFALPVNDQSFLKKEDINEQDEFFHKFFVEQAKRDRIKGVVRHKAKEEEDGDDDEEGERDALDAAEARDADQKVDDNDYQWETDSEEEDFVDSLAQKIIEDHVDGPPDMEDEDPDMEGWDDMYDSDEDEDGKDREKAAGIQIDSDDGGDEEGETLVHQEDDEVDIDDGDDDAFMEHSDDDSDDEEADGDDNFDENEHSDEENAFLGADGSDDDDVHADYSSGGSDEDDLLPVAGDSSSDEDVAPPSKSKASKDKPATSAFVDADEYSGVIERSFKGLKRARRQDSDDEAPEPEPAPKPSGKGKKLKRRKR